jgi:hypothetical protein
MREKMEPSKEEGNRRRTESVETGEEKNYRERREEKVIIDRK